MGMVRDSGDAEFCMAVTESSVRFDVHDRSR